jgi:hypothetical protein
VVIVLDQHDVAKWRERAGRVIGPQLLGEFNFVGARTWSANIDSVVGIRR